MDITTLRTRVRNILMDTSALTWDDNSLDEAIRNALDDYSLERPLVKAAILTLAADGPEIDLAGLADFTDLLQIYAPWYQDPRPEGNLVRGWEPYWDGTSPKVLVQARAALKTGDRARVLYASKHTLAGLDEAELTTVFQCHESIVARGAAAYAAQQRGVDRSEGFAAAGKTAEKLFAWGKDQLMRFYLDLNRIRPRGWALAGLTGGWEAE